MSKKIVRRSGIQLVCGQAKPGASLAFLKNMALFCREFNEKTKEKIGLPVNVEITVYADNSYSYTIGTPPTSYLLKEIIGKEKGTRKKEISKAEIRTIVQEKLENLNTENYQEAEKIIIGTIRSFNGVKIIND